MVPPSQRFEPAREAAGELALAPLLEQTCERLRRLTRKMLKGYPGLRRWEQTDDVLQNALLRLLTALQAVRPESEQHFFSLAARHLRWELLDLARHYFGAEGLGKNHATAAENDPSVPPRYDRPDANDDPARLAEWREFHEQVDRLPEPERAVVDLLVYNGLKQAEAAAVLGVTVRTVQNRYAAALLHLRQVLKGELPGT